MHKFGAPKTVDSVWITFSEFSGHWMRGDQKISIFPEYRNLDLSPLDTANK